MIRKLQNLLLRVLLRLSDGPVTIHKASEDEKEMIRRWMVNCYADPGYQIFTKYREAKFIISLSDLGMDDQPRDKYNRVIGQRFELLRWNDIMRKVFEKNSEDQKKKQDISTK